MTLTVHRSICVSYHKRPWALFNFSLKAKIE